MHISRILANIAYQFCIRRSDKEIKRLKEELDLNFTSEYEIAAQNVVEYLIQSRNINLQEKLRQLFLDLLITGTAYYKVVPTKNGKNLTIDLDNNVPVLLSIM